MLIPYLSMLLILIIIGYQIKKIYTYVRILFCNLEMASEPQINTKLKSVEYGKAYKTAVSQYEHSMQVLFYPLIAAFFNVLVMCGLSALDIPLTQLHIIASVLVTAAVLTESILLNTFPKWLYDWTIVLMATRDEINLDIMRNRLLTIKAELREVINGKEISTIELNNLKYEGLMLSQQAEELAAEVQARSEY